MNVHLEKAGKNATVNPRSFAKRGVNKEPSKHHGIGEGIHRKESEIKARNQDIDFINDHRARCAGQPVTKETYNRWYDTNPPKMNYIIDSDNLSPDAIKHRAMMKEHMEGAKIPTMQEVALRNARMKEQQGGNKYEHGKDR